MPCPVRFFKGTTASARNTPFQTVFSPLFMLQGAVVLFAAFRLVENLVLKLQVEKFLQHSWLFHQKPVISLVS